MQARPIDQFGSLTFHRGIMKKMLPKEVFTALCQAMEGRTKINLAHADVIAVAMKEWALSLGATHFCHWFHPLTGTTAEKHDAFLDVGAGGQIIEKFSGKLLFKGEPDASSFPSGGLRDTAAARGYTSWDVESFPFILKSGHWSTLCIPAVFFSWCGKALDTKIPLMKSEEKLASAASRLLRLLKVDHQYVFSTLGPEQEYFLISKELFELRPDLVLAGRTLFGACPTRGQEFQDHYFSSLPERVLSFMQEIEEKATQLGIPVKTRHSEVAPHQYEVAPLFERSSAASSHNLLLMQIMRQVATSHDLVCLFHEKPFAGLNGSGKHCNWSFATDTGLNLLDPALLTKHPLVFLSCITAVLSAVHKHAPLLRASIASPGNDHRLGGHEAPPALLSVYLGEALDKYLDGIEKQIDHIYESEALRDLKISAIPALALETMDRNRTSPFAFTGNKFEFRSVGSSAHPASAVMVLNAIVAESLHEIVDEIEKQLGEKPFKEAVLEVLQGKLKSSRSIRYLGDNYHEQWREEAERRGIVNLPKSVQSFSFFTRDTADRVFEGILSVDERRSRVRILEEQYVYTIANEAKLMLELFQTHVVPVSLEYQTLLASNIHQMEMALPGVVVETKVLLLEVSTRIQEALLAASSLKTELSSAYEKTAEAQTFAFADQVTAQMIALRKAVDALELLVPDSAWPFPKYRELLYSL
jgi:glutamine synthetase